MSLSRRVYAPIVPKMPPGLVELMDGLARDVLKSNPENIYEFCAVHMQKLLEIRDGHAPKSFVTLDQKIAKAQKKIKQREEQRRHDYDQKLLSMSTISSNQQEVLNQREVVDDDKYSETTEIEKEQLTSDIKINEEEKLIIVSISNKYTALDTPSNEKIKEGKETINTTIQDILAKEENHVNDTSDDNNTNEVNDTTDNENTNEVNDTTDNENTNDVNDITDNGNTNQVDATLEDNVTNDILDNNLSQGNHNDQQATVTNVDIDSSAVLLQINDDREDKMKQQDIALQLHCDAFENNIQNDSENLMQTESVNNKGKEGDDVISVDNNIIEIPTPEITTNSKLVCPVNNDIIHSETQKDVSSKTNSLSLGSDGDQKDLFNDNKDSAENRTEDINVAEKLHDDEKILAVILNTQSTEPVLISDQNIDSVTVENSETEQITMENMDTKSVPEFTADISHNSNSSMDLETAAITIQKVFRSFLFKTKTASYDDPTAVDINLLNEDKEKEETNALSLKDRRSLGISRMDTVLQTVNEEKSLSLSTDDSSTLSSAATIIQAHVRGFLVRNKLNLNKTTSTNSLIDSDAPSIPSLEGESDDRKSKTVLNIHIVPEGGHFVSRDESILTSMDLSLDSSPPTSVNLHPLGYDKSERRKQLKREDAIQSGSPPSNNSGKLSDDLDSVKEVLVIGSNSEPQLAIEDDMSTKNTVPDIFVSGEDKIVTGKDDCNPAGVIASDEMDDPTGDIASDEMDDPTGDIASDEMDGPMGDIASDEMDDPTGDIASDEMDVITPFVTIEDRNSRECDNSSKLLHSGEFHDIVVPTNVTRSDTSVVREFQNVLVYFILWNN